MPIIVFWEFNHFVVVDGFSKGCVHLNDPAVGPRTVTDEEFDRSFTGVVMTFEPGDEFVRSGRFPSLTGALRQRLAGSHSALVYGVLAGMALIIPGLLIPAYGRIFVDDVLVSGLEGWLPPLVAAMGLTLLLLLVLNWLQQYILFRLGQKLELSTSGRFIWHVLHLPDRLLRPALCRRRRIADATQRTSRATAVGAGRGEPRQRHDDRVLRVRHDPVRRPADGHRCCHRSAQPGRAARQRAASHGRQPPLRAGAGQGAGHLFQRHPDDRDLEGRGHRIRFLRPLGGVPGQIHPRRAGPRRHDGLRERRADTAQRPHDGGHPDRRRRAGHQRHAEHRRARGLPVPDRRVQRSRQWPGEPGRRAPGDPCRHGPARRRAQLSNRSDARRTPSGWPRRTIR